MITILLYVLSALCLLPWLLFLSVLALFTFLIAAQSVRILVQALCKIGHHAAARVSFWRSDHQFLRDLGIKHHTNLNVRKGGK